MDGGMNWDVQSSGLADPPLYGVFFLDASTGWAVGNTSTILHTTNGGVVWTPQTSPVVIAAKDVEFVDALRGWVVGDNGVVIRPLDGGANWTQQSIGAGENLVGIDFADASTGWIMGQGFAYMTTDGGDTWSFQPKATVLGLSPSATLLSRNS